MTTSNLKIEDLLGIYCVVSFAGQEFKCYNITQDLMHFVKLNKKGIPLSEKNKNNLVNYSQKQVLSYIEKGSATLEVGTISI